MRFFRFSLLLLSLALLLAACGGSPAGAPASSGAPPTSPPAAAEPTAAPAAEAPVGPTTAPAAAPTSAPSPLPQSTAVPAAGASGSIVFGEPTRYAQEGVFTLDVPSGWRADDRSTPGEAEVVFRDPSGAATFLARVTETTPGATDQALTSDLEGYLQKALGANDLKLIPGVRGADGRLPVSFAYTGTREGKVAPYSGGGYVAQRGNLISFTLYAAPADEFAAVRSSFEEIATSYQLAPDAEVR